MATKAKSKSVTVREGMTKARELAQRGTGEVVEQELLDQIAADAGAGFEEATRDAFAIPFLRVLQDLSPQVKKKMAGYVEGARPGQIYNTVTKEVEERVRVIPCYYSQSFIEWVPRDAKGGKEGGAKGFVAAHPPGSPIIHKAVREGSRNILPNGNELQDTRQHFVLVLREDGSTEQAMIAMASTQLKVSRRWMSQMKAAMIPHNGRLIPAPSFAWSYALSSEEEANEQGSWYSWVIADRERVVDPDVYARARAFCASMREGKVNINYEEARDGGGSANEAHGDSAPRDLEDEEEIDA